MKKRQRQATKKSIIQQEMQMNNARAKVSSLKSRHKENGS